MTRFNRRITPSFAIYILEMMNEKLTGRKEEYSEHMIDIYRRSIRILKIQQLHILIQTL